MRMLALKSSKRDKSQRLLARDNAARNDNGRAAPVPGFGLEPVCQGSGLRELKVVLQVATDLGAIHCRSQRSDAHRILLALCKERGYAGKSAPEERAKKKTKHAKVALVACKRTVGNAAAHEEHRNFAPVGLAEEIRPDLGFQNDHDGWPDGTERTSNTKSPIKRKVDHGIREGHPLSGQFLPGDRCRGDDEWAAGVSCFQPFRERNTGKHLSDRNGMNPDGAWMIRRQIVKRSKGKAEALAQIGKIFSLSQALNKPIRQEQKSSKAH